MPKNAFSGEKSILNRWQISDEELTHIMDENPSLRGFIFGYVSEYKARKFFDGHRGISDIKKYDDHDRKSKGDISFVYRGREFKIEAKSLQTNSVSSGEDGIWKGKFQCDASDKRTIHLPNGHTVSTTCLAVGEFDIVAVSCYAFGNTWKFAFAKNKDLPHPNERARNVPAEDRGYLIKSLIDITWPLESPFTEDVYKLLDEIVEED
ncbi:MAG: restriction endonuclease [Clostridia bacterium]|nr:restriction endonuclease [Clostridia bacterium]